MDKLIYLDNAATTKVDSLVVKKVNDFFVKDYGNASSQHSAGKVVRGEIEAAREKIAKFIGADADEIYFTSGGTESNNIALLGLAAANPDKKHIVTTVFEHPAILRTCEALEKNGYKVDYVGVDGEGIVDADEIVGRIKKSTLVVSVMHVNNEIGTVQPIEKISAACRKKGVYFHTDAVQSFSKIDINVEKMDIDLMSVSGHKINAPKGVGFLYVRKGTKINPINYGGGQEGGLRSGTLNSPGIVGLAAALDIKRSKSGVKKIRDKMINELLKIPGAKINGSLKDRVYHNISVSFYGIEGESLMLMLDRDGICVSTGSACASSKLQESYVLKAIGVEELYIHGSLRLTLGSDITDKDADFVVGKIKENVEKLRKISPFKLNAEEK